MAKKIYYNPATLLTLMDYTDKGDNPLPVSKKIYLLQQVIRYLSRKDHISENDIKRTQQAIASYKAELEYLQNQENKKEISDLEPDLMAAINIVAAKSEHPTKDVQRALEQWYRNKGTTANVMEITGLSIKPNTFSQMKKRVDEERRKIAAKK